jgi:hypothetical protein
VVAGRDDGVVTARRSREVDQSGSPAVVAATALVVRGGEVATFTDVTPIATTTAIPTSARASARRAHARAPPPCGIPRLLPLLYTFAQAAR